MTDARTFPVDLDQKRQLRFNTTSLRLLDRELTQLGYGSFASCVQGLVESMEGAEEGYDEVDLQSVNNDVMAIALKYGLRFDMPGIQDQDVDRMLDDAETDVVEVWGRVVEAWVEGSPFGVEEKQEEAGAEGNARSENSSDPYSDAEKGPTRATSARASTG